MPSAKNAVAKMPRASRKTDADDRKKQEPMTVNGITNNFLREIRSLKFAQEETSKVLAASVEKHLAAFNKFH
jgi:hypothetical protein